MTYADSAPGCRRCAAFFPEYADKKIVGAIASLYVDENLVRLGENLGLVVLGFGDDVMQVLNSSGYSFIRRSRSELLTTNTLLKAIAPAAIIGFSL